MQVNLVAPVKGTPPSSEQLALLLPDVLQLLQTTPFTQADQATHIERANRDDRNDEAAKRDTLAAEASRSTRRTDTAVKAERKMLTAQRAQERDLRGAELQDRVIEDRNSFRRELADAATRRQTTTARPNDGCSSSMRSPAQETVGSEPPGQAKANVPANPGNADQATTANTSNPPRTDAASSQLPPSGAPRTAPANEAFSGRDAEATPGAATRSSTATVARPTPPTINAAGSTGLERTANAGVAKVTATARGSGTPAANEPATLVQPSRTERGVGKSASAQSSETTAESGKTDANTARIVRLILSRVDRQHSIARLRLDPPELGKLLLRMDLRDQQLSLRVDAETGEAHRLLSEHLDSLRRSLEASGVQLERVEIRMPTAANNAPDADAARDNPTQSGSQESATREDTESAGGGSHQEPESNGSERTATSPSAETLAPAAESLVNVWA